MFGFFLLFVILAIVIGSITHSWIWGVVSFFVAIILIPRIMLWLSGSHRKGSVTVDEKQVDLLDQLEEIGRIKRELPLNQRGWCNLLGLYVQLREATGMERLEAGDNKLHSQIDAWRNAPFEPWEVKKYNPGNWERLVDPTLDIVNWLTTHGGLPEEYAESFHKAIQVFQKEGHLKLPNVINNGGKLIKLKALESDEDNEPIANTEYTRTPNQAPTNYQWLEETLLPAHYDFLKKIIHRLSSVSSPPHPNQRTARWDRIREMTEDLQNPLLILAAIEEILNRIKDAYNHKDWRQMLGWIVDIRLIDDYRRNKPGYDEATMEKQEKNWAEFFAPTINEARRAKDIDTMLLAIGYNHYLGIDEVATKLLEEVRSEVGKRDMMFRMQKIMENPIMMHEEATINKTREFINTN